jgi:hypothetical protein
MATSKAIAGLFPSLSPGVFFVRPSSGRLYLKWQQLRDGLDKAGLIKRRTYVRKPKDAAGDQEKNDDGENDGKSDSDDKEDAGESSLILLKTICAPWADVVRHWLASFNQRQSLLKESGSTHDYLSIFPCLANKNGLELVSHNSKVLF